MFPTRKTYFNNTLSTSLIPCFEQKLPDGQYTYTLFATIDAPNAPEQSLTLPFVVDTQFPKLLNSKLIIDDYKKTLTITAEDNHYIMLLFLYDENHNYINAFATPTAEASPLVTKSFDVSNCHSDFIYIDIVDYAMNRSTIKIDLLCNK